LLLLLAQTRVTRFITNRLFGKGRRWNGKRFNVETLDGINRFEAFSQKKDRVDPKKVTVTLKTETNHAFDWGVDRSPLSADKKSIVLNYERHQKNWSLWKHMTDELRMLPVDANGQYDILLGLGSMRWSGGALNCSPFCLYRLRKHRKRGR
jgi:hypothetical protein